MSVRPNDAKNNSSSHTNGKPTESSANIPKEWVPRSLAEILNSENAQPVWIIEGILLDGSAVLTSGQPHAGKSLNWLCAAMETVSTRMVWGHFPSPKVERVLYIETEDPAMVVEQRVRELAKGLRIEPKNPPKGFHLICTGPFELVKMEAALITLIEEYKPDWLVVSTLQGLLGDRDWKEQKDMGPINAIFVRLSRRCPIVVITHSPWDGRNKRAAGSITQAANFLSLMHFDKTISKGETKIAVTLDCKMGQETETFDLILDTETVPGKKRPELRRVRYAGIHEPSDKEKILACIKENPAAKATEVAQEVGCSYEYARKTMKQPTPSLPKGFADPDDYFDLRPPAPSNPRP